MFDAAVAAILASLLPALTSAAGGGFLLAHTKTNHNTLFDFFLKLRVRKEPRASSTSILLKLIWRWRRSFISVLARWQQEILVEFSSSQKTRQTLCRC